MDRSASSLLTVFVVVFQDSSLRFSLSQGVRIVEASMQYGPPPTSGGKKNEEALMWRSVDFLLPHAPIFALSWSILPVSVFHLSSGTFDHFLRPSLRPSLHTWSTARTPDM